MSIFLYFALLDQTSRFDLHGEIEMKYDLHEFDFYVKFWMKIKLKVLIC